MDKKEILERIQKDNVKFVSYQFTDVTGSVKSVDAPVYIDWAQINHSALIRIPRYNTGKDRAMRCELRFPDPSSNPYLAFTAMLAAALDGIDNDLQAPAPLNNINIYQLEAHERDDLGIRSLPGSLAEALSELANDQVIKEALGPTIFETFMRAKTEEWEDYRVHVTD